VNLQNSIPVVRQSLSTGVISVLPYRGDAPESLFTFAERRNPKRSFLFVSKVLGRHIPVKPEVMRDSYVRLANRIPSDLPSPVLVLGMAETAVGFGAGIYDQLRENYRDALYLSTTRHPVNGELLCEFKEAHSHATDHLVYLPSDAALATLVKEAKTIVMCDDEATTGNTFFNLLAALRHEGGLEHLEQVVTVTLTDWSGASLAERCDLPLKSVSLISGEWNWSQSKDAELPEMPNVNVTKSGTVAVSHQQNWGRLGMHTPNKGFGMHIAEKIQSGENILVVGTLEFVFEPFLLAEELEAAGANVKFASTTRSPIAVGLGIESALYFQDNYGLGIPNYLYNVVHQRFDRVIVCAETPVDSIDPRLLEELRKVAPLVEVITHD
jgi:hypothetical protein